MPKGFEGHYQQWEGDMYAVECPCGEGTRVDRYGIERPGVVVVEPGEKGRCRHCKRVYWVEGYRRGKIMAEE